MRWERTSYIGMGASHLGESGVSGIRAGRTRWSERLPLHDLEILEELQVGSLQRPLVVGGYPDVHEVSLVGHRIHDGAGEHERLLGVLANARLAGAHPLVVDGELMALVGDQVEAEDETAREGGRGHEARRHLRRERVVAEADAHAELEPLVIFDLEVALADGEGQAAFIARGIAAMMHVDAPQFVDAFDAGRGAVVHGESLSSRDADRSGWAFGRWSNR